MEEFPPPSRVRSEGGWGPPASLDPIPTLALPLKAERQGLSSLMFSSDRKENRGVGERGHEQPLKP